uniref:Uncharacterized protein n=1 Tax=Vitis vinifera TaxID=29760 RepID=F6HF65_VITVI
MRKAVLEIGWMNMDNPISLIQSHCRSFDQDVLINPVLLPICIATFLPNFDLRLYLELMGWILLIGLIHFFPYRLSFYPLSSLSLSGCVSQE